MTDVTIRYWAAAKDAAGVAQETISADTLSGALDAVQARRAGNQRFANVLSSSSFLIGETPVGRRDAATVTLSSGAVVEVLPAFAGG
jgi:sulfur-carrier protein